METEDVEYKLPETRLGLIDFIKYGRMEIDRDKNNFNLKKAVAACKRALAVKGWDK